MVLHADISVGSYEVSKCIRSFNGDNHGVRLNRLLDALHGNPKQQLVLHGLEVGIPHAHFSTEPLAGFDDLVRKRSIPHSRVLHVFHPPTQLHRLVVFPNSQLTWLVVRGGHINSSMMDASIAQCSTLRELILSNCSLDTEAMDALTNAFASGMLQLTHLTWGLPHEMDHHQHLLQAARQWLLAPPRSLVYLDLKACKYYKRAIADCLDDFKALVLAVAQRGEDGWPVKQVNTWYVPLNDAVKIRRFAEKHAVKGVVGVRGSSTPNNA